MPRSIPEEDIAPLLKKMKTADQFNELMQLVQPEVHRLAVSIFRTERRDHTLQPTALVSDAWMKLLRKRPAQFKSREHFFGSVANAMRCTLVDHARGRETKKRGREWVRVNFDEARAFGFEDSDHFLRFDEVLTKLERFDAKLSALVKLRVFNGYTEMETAEILRMGPSTVRARWAKARTWLRSQLEASDTGAHVS